MTSKGKFKLHKWLTLIKSIQNNYEYSKSIIDRTGARKEQHVAHFKKSEKRRFWLEASRKIDDFRTTGKSYCRIARLRSEERRVGKECRSRWSRYHEKKKK